MQVRDSLQEIGTIFDRIDTFQLFCQWLDPLGFNCFLVHAACVEIAYFLDFRRRLRVDVSIGGLLCNLVKSVVVLFGQRFEAAPA